MHLPTAIELIEGNYGTRDNTRIAEGTLDWGKYDPSLQSAWISPNGKVHELRRGVGAETHAGWIKNNPDLTGVSLSNWKGSGKNGKLRADDYYAVAHQMMSDGWIRKADHDSYHFHAHHIGTHRHRVLKHLREYHPETNRVILQVTKTRKSWKDWRGGMSSAPSSTVVIDIPKLTAEELIEAKLSLPSGVELHPESELSKVIASGRHSHLEADSHEHGYDLKLHPEVNSEVATFTNPDYGGRTRTHYYNPKFADVVTDESLPGYPKKRTVLKTGYSSRLPDSEKNDDQKHLYRGISHEEWASIKKTGKVKSTGSMNFAGQDRSTSYSTDPHAAAHYAAGFAPAYHKPTFNKPAYVIKVRNPGGGTALQGASTHERDILHDIDASDIVGVYKGEVYHSTPLKREIRRPDLVKPRWHEGSASGGDSDVVWSKIK